MSTPVSHIPRRWLWLVLGTVLPFGCWREVRPAQEIRPEELWLGAYFGQQKIGFSHTQVRPLEWRGRPVVEVESISVIKVSLMGNLLEEKIHLAQIADLEFSPLHLSFTMSSGERTRSVVAEFFPDRVECQIITPETATETKTVPIAKGVRLVADEQALLEERGVEGLREGQGLELYQFNPVTLAIEKVKLTLMRRETLEFEGKPRRTLVFEHTMPIADSLIWIDEDEGDILKMTSLGLITFLRENKEKAVQFPAAREAMVDLALALAVRPQRPIDQPQQIRSLRMRVWGLETLGQVPSDDWQRVEGELQPGQPVAVTIVSKPFHPERAGHLPFEEEALKSYLRAGEYVEADHPDIVAQAREIVGDERNAYRAAVRIREWVHRRIEWRYDIGVIRSALQILRDPAGVCRDASVLYTALARAAGLPTRVCVGVVYVKDGFYGHAWAETQVGNGQWVAFDPTMASEPVDATHLKLGQGEYTELFRAIKALPGLKIEVLEAQRE